MTNPVNYQNQPAPSYSGVTINITNPTVNAASPYQKPVITTVPASSNIEPASIPAAVQAPPVPVTNPIKQQIPPQEGLAQAYPPQYYMNNYNCPQYPMYSQQTSKPQPEEIGTIASNNAKEEIPEEDLSSSTDIINNLDAREAEQKELEKNSKKTRVIALTNEYIMSLENYLNNPNKEIRLMAAKEVLTRLDEDKERYDDAALNALLNKMLQDPEKLIRIAALSAFSSQLASGNDYTVELLTKIQKDPNADKDDIVQAADILLKMSASTELKYTPESNNTPPEEQKAE